MDLCRALSISRGDVVAVVGAGGKTTTMFRLATELVARGQHVVTTTTTRILAGQVKLAPACLNTEDESAMLREVPSMLAKHGQVLILKTATPNENNAIGLSPDLICRLHDLAEVDAVLVEADGARTRLFKAPNIHEPVIPECTTILIPMVSIDVLGRPLDTEYVHRPEIVARLTGARLGEPVTPEIVAAVLRHPEGGLKECPAGARIIPLINKVECTGQLAAARHLAHEIIGWGVERHTTLDIQPRAPDVLPSSAFDSVLVGAVAGDQPVREVHSPSLAIILAFAESTNLNQPKQLLEIDNELLIRQIVHTILDAGVDQVIVVTLNLADEIKASLADLPVTIAINPDWAQGLSTSVRVGLRAAKPGWGSVLLVQSDRLSLSKSTLQALIQRHRETLAPIVYPSIETQLNTTTLFDRTLAEDLMALEGDESGYSLLQKYRNRAQTVPVDNAGILRDI